MTKPSAAVFAAMLVATLVAASPVAGAVGRANPVAVKQWTASVCRDFDRWTAGLTTSDTPGALADPASTKAAITKYLTRAIKTTNTLISDLKRAGVPAVTDGKPIAATFNSSARSLRKAFTRAKAKAAGLSTVDPAAFATGAQALLSQLQTAGAALETTLTRTAKRHPAAKLDKAFSTTTACTAAA